MLSFGYKAGVPAGVITAWGCRAIVDQITGSIDVPPDRQSAIGPQVDALLDHLNRHVQGAWRDRASELLLSGQMHTRSAAELVLYQDNLVIIKGKHQRQRRLPLCVRLLPCGCRSTTTMIDQ